MKIIEVKNKNKRLTEQLIEVWEGSVKATHHFLTATERDKIKKLIPQALDQVKHLIIAEDEKRFPVAFMGIEEQKLEMLFVSPEVRGKGIGKKLIQYGIEKYFINEVAVNEQNPQGRGFYEHLGFQVYKRTDFDEQGNPYPLLYMKLV